MGLIGLPDFALPDLGLPDFALPTVTDEVLNSPSSILAKYLVQTARLFSDEGDGLDWPLYKSRMPDATGVAFEIAAIFDTTPISFGKEMDGTLIEGFGIQIRLRSKLYETGFCKLASVVRALAKVYGAGVVMSNGGSYEIVNISVASDVVYIGPDEKQRSHFTTNLILKLRDL